MKKLILIPVFIFFVLIIKAQVVTVDPSLNAYSMQQISIALTQLDQLKKENEEALKAFETAKSTLKMAKQTADLLQAVANDKVDFKVISDLGFNDMGSFVMKALCIDPKDYIPNNASYLKIIASFRLGIGQCSNYNNYINSFSGMHYKLTEGFYGDESGNGNGASTEKIINDMQAAQQQADAMALMNDRTKLEVGYKYLDLSEDLSKKSLELSKALDSDELKLSKAERLNLKLSCVDFQLKSMDYKLKGMNLVSEASQYTEAQRTLLEAQRNKLVMNQMIKMSL